MKKSFFKLSLILLSFIVLISWKKKEDFNKDTLIVGLNVNFPPFEYYENGKPEGFDIDLGNAIGKKLGKKVIFKDMEFATLLNALQTEKIDLIISGMSITEERKKMVNYSNPYFSNGLSLIVKENETKIKSLDDLKGKKVGTQIGTTSDELVDSMKGVENVKVNNPANAVLQLASNKIDAVILDKPVAKKMLSANKGVKILENVDINKEELGIAINKKYPELLKNINSILKELKKEGFFDKLAKKYSL